MLGPSLSHYLPLIVYTARLFSLVLAGIIAINYYKDFYRYLSRGAAKYPNFFDTANERVS